MPARCSASSRNRPPAFAIRRADPHARPRCALPPPTSRRLRPSKSPGVRRHLSYRLPGYDSPPCTPGGRPRSKRRQLAPLDSFQNPTVVRGLLGNQVVLRRNNLPPSVTLLPSIGELVSTLECLALLVAALQVQNTGNHMDVAKIVELHSFVSRPLNSVRSGDALDDVTSAHDHSILRINEVRSEQLIEGARITLHESSCPLIFELKRCAR